MTTRKKPVSKKELFNFCHSNLQIIAEKVFKITKQYFRIFKSAPEYNFTIQIYLIFAVTTLHNFIWKYWSYEDIYNKKELLAKRKDKKRGSEENIETKVIW